MLVLAVVVVVVAAGQEGKRIKCRLGRCLFCLWMGFHHDLRSIRYKAATHSLPEVLGTPTTSQPAYRITLPRGMAWHGNGIVSM
uniref:Secreted protein n=1 Tax=Phakopsora pachyrhizi TaxID=170000 RepID=A0A0S1MIJ4_PHAPC